MTGTGNLAAIEMTERLKVLFITSWYPTKELSVGGVFVREHAQAVKLYDDVVVLHLCGAKANLSKFGHMERETDENLTQGIPTWRVWHKPSPIPHTSFPLHLKSVLRTFRHLVRNGFSPHIIHAHVYDAGLSAVILGRLNHIPVIITEHSTAFPRQLLSPKQVWMARLAFQGADRILPVSDALQQAIERYGIRARFSLVPNVVDTGLFAPGPRSDSSLKRLVFVGSLIPVKGIPFLLQAVARLSSQDWCLDIVGDGPNRAEYEQMSVDLRLGERVTFYGLRTKSEVAEFMRQADLFVLPSFWENLPCVLIEAMASGLPIVSTQVGGIPEIVDRETGILVPPQDVGSLSHAIGQMLESLDRFDRHTIAHKAARYSQESVGKLLHSIYLDCLTR